MLFYDIVHKLGHVCPSINHEIYKCLLGMFVVIPLDILYQYRLSKAQLSYFDHLSIRKDRFGLPRLSIQQGYQSKIYLLTIVRKVTLA